jgi:hypothetical protein
VVLKNPVRFSAAFGDQQSFTPNGDGHDDTANVSWCVVGHALTDAVVLDATGRPRARPGRRPRERRPVERLR